jgi:hypothetical protein
MILANAVKEDHLKKFKDPFERILNSTDSDYQKQIDLERLKTDMEFVLCVPLFTDDRYKEEHPEVMSLYRKIKSKMV